MNVRLLDKTSKIEAQEVIITIGYLISYDENSLFFTDYQKTIAKLIELQGSGIFPSMQEVTSRGRQKNEIVKNYMASNGYSLISAIPLICRITGNQYYLVNQGMDSMFPGKFLNASLYIMRKNKLKLIQNHKKRIIKKDGLFIDFDNLKIGLREFEFLYVKFENQ